MPYIESEEDRMTMDSIISGFIWELQKKGNLNYFLCKLFLSSKMSYEHARNFIGELENAKLEIYRRWVVPYEDLKKKGNGDVNG